MRYLVMALLAAGTVAGFSSGFRAVRARHAGWDCHSAAVVAPGPSTPAPSVSPPARTPEPGGGPGAG